MDKEGANVNLSYLKRWFSEDPILREAVDTIVKDGIRLKSGLFIKSFPRSLSAVAGVNSPAGNCLDEVNQWKLQGSIEQDKEIESMVLRGQLGHEKTAQLFKTSSPRKKVGILYADYQASYGVDEDDYRCYWHTDVFASRPDLDPKILENLKLRNPREYNVLYGGGWHEGADQFIESELIDNCIQRGIHQRKAEPGDKLVLAIDPSSGGADSFCASILALRNRGTDREKIVQLAMVGYQSKSSNKALNVDKAVKGISKLAGEYGLTQAYTDNHHPAVQEVNFARERIQIRTKNYPTRNLIWDGLEYWLRQCKIELLDNSDLERELKALIRTPSGTVQHLRSGHDDFPQTIALGVFVLAGNKQPQLGAVPIILEATPPPLHQHETDVFGGYYKSEHEIAARQPSEFNFSNSRG